MKIHLRKSDRQFTQLVRIKYDFTCQKCGRKYIKGVHNLGNLGVSHYFGRRKESTRFDLDNVTLLCNFPCHYEWESEKRRGYEEYMIERLGEEGLLLLEYRSNQYQKRDDKMMEMYLKQELEAQDV